MTRCLLKVWGTTSQSVDAVLLISVETSRGCKARKQRWETHDKMFRWRQRWCKCFGKCSVWWLIKWCMLGLFFFADDIVWTPVGNRLFSGIERTSPGLSSAVVPLALLYRVRWRALIAPAHIVITFLILRCCCSDNTQLLVSLWCMEKKTSKPSLKIISGNQYQVHLILMPWCAASFQRRLKMNHCRSLDARLVDAMWLITLK